MQQTLRRCRHSPTVEARRAWRELLITTPGLSDSISGVILYDETIRQQTTAGTAFLDVLSDAGILAGIKVDTGTTPLAGHPGEKVTEGLDGLRQRLSDYASLGARFVKWRAVFTVADGLPTGACLTANAGALARYASLCQEAGLVPVVEPEVLMAGRHTLTDCAAATGRVLQAVFEQLTDQDVLLEGMLLKPNMVLPGRDAERHGQDSVDEVAQATLTCLLRNVPAAVPGIVFLSGGQPPADASERLNAMNIPHRTAPLPWAVSFSFGRAIQQPALHTWKGQQGHFAAAQRELAHRATCNAAARRGEYTATLEQVAA